MYDYGLIKGGSFFGDISLLLNKPNEYSFFYNPHQEKPLQMLKLSAEQFLNICKKYPVEHEIWVERAKKRSEFINNYKILNLLKFMKSIIKNPKLIKQNRLLEMKDKYSLPQRLRFMRDRDIMLNLFKLFVRQYEL